MAPLRHDPPDRRRSDAELGYTEDRPRSFARLTAPAQRDTMAEHFEWASRRSLCGERPVKVSGTVILTRKALVTSRYGAEAWHGLFRDMALNHACFRRPITANSTVPLAEFLAFHDELARRFCAGGRDSLSKLGAEAARFAHLGGPLGEFVVDTDITSLVSTIPGLWPRYFPETDSRFEAALTDAGVELEVRDLPAWHPYFEYLVVGYIKELLELYCANPITSRRVTGGRGTSYGYLLSFDPRFAEPPSSPSSAEPSPATPRSSNKRRGVLRSMRALTDRELEVLTLVGRGKTNREIAFLLCISEKTVQNHVTHAYEKLGIYSRTGAALWLAERGLAD
jgi:DNA-binding CsgD family transcriptional regulator